MTSFTVLLSALVTVSSSVFTLEHENIHTLTIATIHVITTFSCENAFFIIVFLLLKNLNAAKVWAIRTSVIKTLFTNILLLI